MRDIKFNIYDKTTDTYYRNSDYDINIDFGNKTIAITEKKGYSDVTILDYEKKIECVLLQYTGLKGKNEVEIYEGDIIEDGYTSPMSNKFISKKYIINYKNDGFMGELIGSSPWGDTWLHFINGEVIGNIYQNPELLEG